MTTKSRLLAIPVLLAVVAGVASCSPVAQSSPQPSPAVCDGVSSDMGGCTAERHTFIGDTCQDLAREWATVLNGGIVRVLQGPAVVENQGRSVLIRQALVITTVDLNMRLQELDLQADCDQPEFMAAAEPRFSAELRAGVGDALYDGLPPASYNDWLQDVRNVVRTIDDGE